jgi:hypothetical protein
MPADVSSSATRARIRIAIAILLLSVACLIALDRHGKRNRISSSGHEVIEVDRPEQVYEAWRARGARGRTLLLFGTFPHPWRSTDQGVDAPGPASFVTLAALENVIRRIYVLVPDDRWDALFGVPLPGFFRAVPGLERGLYMHYPLGLPVIATTPSSLPRLSEPSLVYVDRERFELPDVERILSEKGAASDLIVVSRGM